MPKAVLIICVCLAGAARADFASDALAKAEELRQKAVEASPGVAEATSKGFTQVMSASTTLTSQAADAMADSLGNTGEILKTVLGITDQMLKGLVASFANLAFCALMLWGFLKLPPDFMLVVGFFTFFVGPALVVLLLKLLGSIGFLAAAVPMVFIGVLFILTLFKSAAMQYIGLKMGLDKNNDGKVDFKDVVFYVQNAPWYKKFKAQMNETGAGGFVKLDDVEAALAKDQATIDSLQSQMDALNDKLNLICSKLGVAVPPSSFKKNFSA